MMRCGHDAVIDCPRANPLSVGHEAIVEWVGKSPITHHRVYVLAAAWVERILAGALTSLTSEDLGL